MRVDLADKRRDLLVDRQTQAVERAVDGQARGNVGAVQPALVDGGVVVVLEVRALGGVGAAEQRRECFGAHSLVRVAVCKAGGENGGKLLCRPRGDVRQATCGQGHARVVPHRGGKAAEGAREHHQRLCACQRAVERKAAVGIALENVGPLHAGVIVLRGGEQRLRGLAARERRRLHGRRAERQHQCEQQRHKSFLEFHHVISPLDAWIV